MDEAASSIQLRMQEWWLVQAATSEPYSKHIYIFINRGYHFWYSQLLHSLNIHHRNTLLREPFESCEKGVQGLKASPTSKATANLFYFPSQYQENEGNERYYNNPLPNSTFSI